MCQPSRAHELAELFLDTVRLNRVASVAQEILQSGSRLPPLAGALVWAASLCGLLRAEYQPGTLGTFAWVGSFACLPARHPVLRLGAQWIEHVIAETPWADLQPLSAGINLEGFGDRRSVMLHLPDLATRPDRIATSGSPFFLLS